MIFKVEITFYSSDFRIRWDGWDSEYKRTTEQMNKEYRISKEWGGRYFFVGYKSLDKERGHRDKITAA
jgi:hypothetical protein